MDYPQIDIIPELDITVIRDPTDVWLLKADVNGLRKLYEQWEQYRRFKAKAIYHADDGDFYMKNNDDPFGVRVEDTDTPLGSVEEAELAPLRPGKRHKVGLDETLWTVARAYKLSPTKLMDYNEIIDPKTVVPGSWLYIPKPDAKERPRIEYKLLDHPYQMHIDHAGYTTKYMFGGVRKWGDIKADLKQWKNKENVDIYAIAKVPVEGEIAAYYMDRHDLGDIEKFKETGRVAYTRGFNWQHLAEGHIEKKAKLPTTTHEAIAETAMLFDDRPEPAIDSGTVEVVGMVVQPEETPVEEPVEAEVAEEPQVEDWRSTFKYLNVEESPERFRLLEDMDIRDIDGLMPAIHRKADSYVMVDGWFTHEGTPYYHVATKHGYGVPTQYAYSVEDEAFALQVDLPTRAAHGLTLSAEERRVVRVAKIVARYNKLTGLVKQIKRRK